MSDTRQHYDILVIGSGPAGQKAAVQGAKEGKRVVGVVSILPDIRDPGIGEPGTAEPEGERWRMVGLAVLVEERGVGVGAMLVRAAQAIAANRGGGLWCTAEDEATVAFLKRRAFVNGGGAVLLAQLQASPPSEDDEE